MLNPAYGACLAPHCKFWAPRCSNNYCQKCCERLHEGQMWYSHYRPNGVLYMPGASTDTLPVHYGGKDNKADDKAVEPQDPVVGAIEEIQDNKEVLIPLTDNSYFTPRGQSSKFPIKYVK